MNTNYKSTILAITLFFALSASVSAAPGDLDPTFGSGGVVITPFTFPGPLTGATFATDVAVQSDGKIVIVGNLTNVGPNRIILARYNANGSLDASFGNGGKFITSFEFNTNASGIAIQPDGRIVVVGNAFINMDHHEYLAARFETNGTLDASFGTGGAVLINMGGINVAVTDVAIQPNGKIVIVGDSDNYTFAIARLNPGGSLDTSFDGDGKVFANIGVGYATKAALQQDGKIIVAGSIDDDSIIARYNADGSLDATFDGDGIVVTSVGLYFGGFFGAVAVQPDGKIVAAGAASDEEESGFASVVRYHPTGALDTSFGGDGIVATLDVDYFFSVAIQSNGKIVTASGWLSSPTLVRYNANGSLDSSFGNGGIRTDQFGYSSLFYAMALQPDGKIVAAGYNVAAMYNDRNILVVRYLGDVAVSNTKPFDFDGDGRADISVFRPSDRTWYLNRSTDGFAATQFGLSTDKIVPADFDGDGKTDIAVFRDGEWYLLRSQAGFLGVQFGMAGDIPQPADFNGDGRAELAVFRGGNWFTLNLATNQVNAVQFGIPNDKPVVGDYDGDGRSDYAVYRDGTWYLLRSTQGFTAIQFGLPTDKLVPADYDGDGKTDLAVYREGTWYLLGSQIGFTTFQFGLASDIPAAADYDGDGRTDAGVYRDGAWHLLQTTAGTSSVQFGTANDVPIPAAYVR